MKSNKKYIVITGASSGIGMEAAKAFAKRGENLILVARRIEMLDSIKKEILATNHDLDIVNIQCDLSIADNTHKLFEQISEYQLSTLINNAGFGNFSPIATQDLSKIQAMLHLNIESLTILSTLFANKYANVDGTQIINISSVGGYSVIFKAVSYCASKFYVSAFTEGLAQELKILNAKMKAKVLAPAATETEFADNALNIKDFNYQESVAKFHTAAEMAQFLLQLFDSDKVVGIVNPSTYEFTLQDPIFTFKEQSSTGTPKK